MGVLLSVDGNADEDHVECDGYDGHDLVVRYSGLIEENGWAGTYHFYYEFYSVVRGDEADESDEEDDGV
jgi:hypothetical protein